MKRGESPTELARRTRELQNSLEAILAEFPHADRDNVWHTLLLLEQPPIERLRRGLLRARKFDFH